jgi:hypothetical protein
LALLIRPLPLPCMQHSISEQISEISYWYSVIRTKNSFLAKYFVKDASFFFFCFGLYSLITEFSIIIACSYNLNTMLNAIINPVFYLQGVSKNLPCDANSKTKSKSFQKWILNI